MRKFRQLIPYQAGHALRRFGVVPKKHVFVVTYGRSGSTLLMKLINSIRGFNLKGENNGAIQNLIEAVRVHEIGQERYGGELTKSIEQPWYGIDELPHDDFRRTVMRLISRKFFRSLRPNKVGGFKEIRYFLLDDDAFHYHIDFLLGFRAAKIIFLTRSSEQVRQSAWWQERDPAEVTKLVERMDDLFATAARNHPDRTWTIDYSDLTRFDKFRKVLEFLDGDLTEAEFRKIVAKKINQSV